ncbi:MAG: integration host factor subunit beta [Chitinivibrionia bacterium]|nr:integration host factor subunit beta [Chitinivibrionia bacterium]
MSSVKKSDLVSKISAQTGLAAVDTKIIVDELVNAISLELENGNTIELRGFATFSVKNRRPRIARNITTGEQVSVPAKKDIVMKPSKHLKEMVDK